MPIVYLHAFLNDLAELLDLLNSLPIPLFHLLHNLQRAMLLTEHAISLVSIAFLQLHAVVVSPSTFNMEGNSTPRCLALHAGAILLQAYDALQVEPLLVEL